MAVERLWVGVFGGLVAVEPAKIREIPCIFPCYRELLAETSSHQTASTARSIDKPLKLRAFTFCTFRDPYLSHTFLAAMPR